MPTKRGEEKRVGERASTGPRGRGGRERERERERE